MYCSTGEAFDLLKLMVSVNTVDLILSKYYESIPIDDRLMKNDKVG